MAFFSTSFLKKEIYIFFLLSCSHFPSLLHIRHSMCADTSKWKQVHPVKKLAFQWREEFYFRHTVFGVTARHADAQVK
jgi:hypothetical protein